MKPIYGLAKAIFQDQNAGGHVPPDVLAAARAVLKSTDTDVDRQKIYAYRGIKHSGRSAFRQQMRGVNSLAGSLGNYATLASTVMQGGTAGVAAGIGLAAAAAQDIEKIVKSKAFLGAVKSVVGIAFDDPNVARKMVYGLRRATQYLGPITTGIGIGAAGLYGISSTSDVLDGMGGGEALRLAKAAASPARFNQKSLTFLQRETLLWKERTERVKADNPGAWIPVLGDLVTSIRLKRRGLSPELLGQAETIQAGRDARAQSSGKQIRQLARERLFKDRYGGTLGRYFENRYDQQIKKIVGSNAETEAAITAKAQQMLNEAAAHRAEFYRQVRSGDFKAAAAERSEANLAVPRMVNRSPEQAFMAQESARVGGRMWAISQMPRAGERSWDDP